MKRHLVVSVMLLLSPAVASALPFFAWESKLIPKAANRGACADFTGHWAGTCTYSGKQSPLELKIDQNGCDGIMLNSEYLNIGGLETRTATGPSSLNGGATFAYTASVTLRWNHAQDELNIDQAILMSALQPTAKPTNFSGTGSMSLHNGKLVMKQAMGQFGFDCELDKGIPINPSPPSPNIPSTIPE